MRSNRNGWDSIQKGKIYQYKEGGFICFVKVIEDISDKETYRFRVRILPYLDYPAKLSDNTNEWDISASKNCPYMFDGMIQLYDVDDSASGYISRAEIDLIRSGDHTHRSGYFKQFKD